jgi:hypothetical protein
MVNHGPIAWPDLNLLYPFVLGDPCWEDNVLVHEIAVRWNLKILRHFEDKIGRTDAPTCRERASGRRFSRITLAGAVLCPGFQLSDLAFV